MSDGRQRGVARQQEERIELQVAVDRVSLVIERDIDAVFQPNAIQHTVLAVPLVVRVFIAAADVGGRHKARQRLKARAVVLVVALQVERVPVAV